uniref:RRM domain-containing protein n=1 Tax=Caenorhabditis angaria TaxID=860376 RepID=B6VBU5_9PELO|nr:hypothetical protein Csp3_JD02.016 [Caenorhabditis angaria]
MVANSAKVTPSKKSPIKTISATKTQSKPQTKKRYLWVIKLQCLPFGFFENELLGYFRQFGSVIRVRVARSTKTGNHKGWAYVGFDNKEVAEIAAETMNGYLMFEHRLIVKLMKPEQIPKCMLKGSTLLPRPTYKGQAKRDAIKRNKSDGKNDARDLKRRNKNFHKTLTKLKNMGIDYDFSSSPSSASKDKDIQVIPKTPKVVKVVTPVVTPKQVATPTVKTPQIQKIQEQAKTPKFSPKTRAAKKAAATPAPAPQQSSIQKAIQKSVAASARPAPLEKRTLRGKKKSL